MPAAPASSAGDRLGRPQPVERGGLEELTVQAGGRDVVVDVGEEGLEATVGGRRRGREVVGEGQAGAVDGGQVAGQPHAEALQRGQVDVAVVAAADQLDGALVARPDGVLDLVDRAAEGADPVEPPPDVHAAIAAGQPAVAANGEHDVATGADEFVGDLHAGRRRPHDQHPAVGHEARIAIGVRGDLGDAGVELVGEGRHAGLVAPAGGDDDVGRSPRAGRGVDAEAAVVLAHGEHVGALLDRGGKGPGVVGQVAGHRDGAHVPVGRGALVAPAGQAGGPVGAEESQGVPDHAAPALGRLASLEHHMVDVGVGEATAHGQAGLAGADDEGVGGGGGGHGNGLLA